MTSPLRIVQISDIHLYLDQNKTLLGVNTTDSFNAVLELLQNDSVAPGLILLTGDLSQDGAEATYRRLGLQMKSFKVPVYAVPGNHDNYEKMVGVYPFAAISDVKHIILEHWHIILLNSQKPEAVSGLLAETELKYLRACLDAYPEHHALVCFHHQPVPVGSAWLDNLGLQNADELWSLLAHYPRMNTILFGHVHQEHSGEKNGIKYFSTPSTCIQFKRGNAGFALEELAPGYRWVDLYADGRLETGVKRTEHYIGIFDQEAKGY